MKLIFLVSIIAMPPMIRYPHDMVPHVPPNGVMIGQRPMMMEPHYVQPESAPMGICFISHYLVALS